MYLVEHPLLKLFACHFSYKWQSASRVGQELYLVEHPNLKLVAHHARYNGQYISSLFPPVFDIFGYSTPFLSMSGFSFYATLTNSLLVFLKEDKDLNKISDTCNKEKIAL